MNSYQEGLNLLLEGRRDEALTKLKKVVREAPDNIEAWLTLGNLLKERGEVDRAIQIHRNLLVKKRLPKSLFAQLKKALVLDYVKVKKYSKAIPILQELIDSDSKEVSNYRLLLSIYEKLKDWKQAIEVYKKIFKLAGHGDKTDLAFYYSFVATRQLDQSQESEAEKNLKRALRLNGNCVPALLYHGDIDYRHRRLKDAKEKWLRIVNNFPHLAHLVFHRLEKLYFEEGNFSEILTLYENLRKESIKDKAVLSALVRLYEKMGRKKDAIETLKEILSIDPADIESRGWLIRLFAEVNEPEKIVEQAKELCSMYPSEFYECMHCGHRSRRFFFRCPECQEWKEEVYLSCGGVARKRS
jgi:lipopolysaccharide biosynthesis regulator YciM